MTLFTVQPIPSRHATPAVTIRRGKKLHPVSLPFLLVMAMLTGSLHPIHAQTNFCASSGGNQSYEWMYGMQLSTNSSFTDGSLFTLGSSYKTGYYDWTGQSANTFEAGSTVYYTLYMNSNSTYYEMIYFWLDKDQDANLVDPDERVQGNSTMVTGVTAYTGSFIMPAPAQIGSGTVFGRIIMTYSSTPPLCGSYDFGTTFDFRIGVTGGTLNNVQSMVSVTVSGTGTVTSDPAGISTSTSQTANFSPRKTVDLTATPGEGQQFSYWTGTGITGQSTSNPCTFTTSESNETRSYTAVFVPACVSATAPGPATGSATGTTGASLSWAASTGTATITYFWSVKRVSDGVSVASGNTTGTTAATSALEASTGYYLEVYASNCVGTSATTTSSTFYTYPANPMGITADSNPVCSGWPTSLTATGAQGTVYWYTGSCGETPVGTGNPISVTPALATTYFAKNYNNGYYSAGCASVTVTLSEPSFDPGTFTVSELQASGSSIQWYAAATGGTPLPGSTLVVDGNHYYATQTVGGVESRTRLDVIAQIDNTPCKPTGQANQDFPAGSTVGSLQATGSNIRWYPSSSGGTPLSAGTLLMNGNHYYATQTIDCTESATRFDVTATIH